MISHGIPVPAEINGHSINLRPPLRAALQLLDCAYQCAMDTGEDSWNFAVEIGALIEAGLTTTDLRWLTAKGYVHHAEEITSAGASCRRFKQRKGFCYGETTAFLLTERGAEFARELANGGVGQNAEQSQTRAMSKKDLVENREWRPHWNSAARRLELQDYIVKELRVPARNQELVLSAFQEENWPFRVDDPLPLVAHVDPKQRLRTTIKSLNRNQRQRLIVFRGDGTGTGVCWSPGRRNGARVD